MPRFAALPLCPACVPLRAKRGCERGGCNVSCQLRPMQFRAVSGRGCRPFGSSGDGHTGAACVRRGEAPPHGGGCAPSPVPAELCGQASLGEVRPAHHRAGGGRRGGLRLLGHRGRAERTRRRRAPGHGDSPWLAFEAGRLLVEIKAAEVEDRYGRPGQGARWRMGSCRRGRYSWYGNPGKISRQVQNSGQGGASDLNPARGFHRLSGAPAREVQTVS